MDCGALEGLVTCLEEFDPAVKEAASKAAKHAQARGTDLAKLAITEFVRCDTDACQHFEV